MKVLYADREVPSLSKSIVSFWNAGSEPIRRDDIAERSPLRITAVGEARLLNARVIKSLNEASDTKIEISPNNGSAIIEFEFINTNDGAKCEITHTGATSKDIRLVGSIIGGEEIEPVDIHDLEMEDLIGPLREDRLENSRRRLSNLSNSMLVIQLIILPFFAAESLGFSFWWTSALVIPMIIVYAIKTKREWWKRVPAGLEPLDWR